MILSTQKFKAYDDRCGGTHDAMTFAYDSESERDMESILLRKNKAVLFVKNQNVKRLGWTEYWTTAHYKPRVRIQTANVAAEYSI